MFFIKSVISMKALTWIITSSFFSIHFGIQCVTDVSLKLTRFYTAGMKELSLRDVKSFAQGHKASE